MTTKDSDIFPELNHELIKPLQNVGDVELWELWQKYPQQAKYLLMFFYRYFSLVNNLTTSHASSSYNQGTLYELLPCNLL